MTRTVLFLLAFILTACTGPAETTITFIGTNDVHGQLQPRDDRGGLLSISAYVEAVRAVRREDNGHVLVIDAGDMWQGTLESNITEGAAVVAAYNALGFDAAAIGNHEFDFGPIGPKSIPLHDEHDRRGALKQRALEATFPLLAANIVYRDSGKPLDWENVHPSVMLEAGKTKIGVIGVLAMNGLFATIAANVDDLTLTPIADAVIREATKLRADGADLVIVTAHAGGRCEKFDDPNNLSSCVDVAEIFQVARALPEGLVDHIFAGHVHQGLAHIVNGISISSAWSRTVAFSRVDFTVDSASGAVKGRKVYPPHRATGEDNYESQPLVPHPGVAAVIERALAFSEDQKRLKLGIHLGTPFTQEGNPESPLGNLFLDALLEKVDGDIVLHTVEGSLRADLPAGDLTFGSIYEAMPFENHIVIIPMSGAELRRVVGEQSLLGRRRAGFSGMRVAVTCEDGAMDVTMTRLDGSVIEDTDNVRVITSDYIALGGNRVLAPIMPEGGYPIDASHPMLRDTLIQWFQERGGAIRAEEFMSDDNPKWIGEYPLPRSCRLP